MSRVTPGTEPMRTVALFIASALLAGSALPALAIDPSEAPAIYDNSDLSDQADIALWCGAAFQLIAGQAQGDDVATYTNKAQVLLTRAATLMVQEGTAPEDAGPIAEAYTYHVADQFAGNTDEADYSEDDCEAEAAK